MKALIGNSNRVCALGGEENPEWPAANCWRTVALIAAQNGQKFFKHRNVVENFL
jgi:hypothetical protein